MSTRTPFPTEPAPQTPRTSSLPTLEQFLENHTRLNNKAETHPRCIICQADFLPDHDDNHELIITLEPCQHEFHANCYDQYRNTTHTNRNQCPLCRTELFIMEGRPWLQAEQVYTEGERMNNRFTGTRLARLEWVSMQTDVAFHREFRSRHDYASIPAEIVSQYRDEFRDTFISPQRQEWGHRVLQMASAARLASRIRIFGLQDTREGWDLLVRQRESVAALVDIRDGDGRPARFRPHPTTGNSDHLASSSRPLTRTRDNRSSISELAPRTPNLTGFGTQRPLRVQALQNSSMGHAQGYQITAVIQHGSNERDPVRQTQSIPPANVPTSSQTPSPATSHQPSQQLPGLNRSPFQELSEPTPRIRRAEPLHPETDQISTQSHIHNGLPVILPETLRASREYYRQNYHVVAEMTNVSALQREQNGGFIVHTRQGQTVGCINEATRFVQLFPGYVILFRERDRNAYRMDR